MDDAEPEELHEQPNVKPRLTHLRLALAPYTVHFTNPGYIKEETLRMLELSICKQTLVDTRKDFELRYTTPNLTILAMY